MRLSYAFIPTLKEIPADATMKSHQLMLRAGLMRQLTAGVYAFLPLAYRAMLKAMEIIREEMNAIGGQEFHLPALNPESLWVTTGRRNIPNLILSIKERDLVLAPTHEEVIAWLAAYHIQSYKDLPQIWYQIQTKFRNEPRPRSGVLRGRQFIMKDSYTLDATWEGLDASYQAHAEAYRKIFRRCGLDFFEVGASSGAMGGTGSQEFMIESPSGEDTVVLCPKCGYAANLEIAESALPPLERKSETKPLEEIHTPNVRTIDELARFLKVDQTRLAKSVVYQHDGKPLLALMVGNDELNEAKLTAALGAGEVKPIPTEELLALTGADGGSIGPVGLKNFRIIADRRLKNANGMISGANRNDYHLGNIDFTRDVTLEGFHDLRTVESEEPCVSCNSPLKVSNAIELGHIFKLGTKYSEALDATFLDENGKAQPVIMGSYGIGVERIIACHIEQSHDEHGIVWNKALAPYDLHLIAANMNHEETVKISAGLYEELREIGVEVLFDDRTNVSPGFKFKDADLMGMPVQVIVGERGLKERKIEIKRRRSGERTLVPIQDAVGAIRKMIAD
ncbi:MAG: proline--tRNA ligase [Ignavibacteria bacterium]|nr:proline--tRNA ligase [Ignavibacteria bacterium]